MEISNVNEDTPTTDNNPEMPTETNPNLDPAQTPTVEPTTSVDTTPNPDTPETPTVEPMAQAETPMAQPMPATVQTSPASSPGLIVLQWLTYAFWGWTILAMACLTVSVFSSFIGDNDTGTFTAYATAAALVLLPISLVADIFYSKHEPVKKTGAATLVMIIHAVIFALFGIGALISIVVSIVTMFVSDSDSSGNQVALYSSLVILPLYAATFMRTLNPEKFRWIPKTFKIFMVAIVGAISLLGLFGPVAQERVRKSDRLIENNIYEVVRSINGYARTNDKLPSDLGQLNANGDQQKLISANLLQYTANTKQPKYVSSSNSNDDYSLDSDGQKMTYYYKLCATFKREKKDTYSSYAYDNLGDDGYMTSISAYTHPAGEKCYNVKTSGDNLY